jgi:hypothetical protein
MKGASEIFMKPEPQSVLNIPPDVREQVVRYLFDEMDDAERRSLDDSLISTPEFSDTIASIEDELILQYVCGDLDPRLLSRFNEVYMASPAKLARVENARALRRAVQEISAERKPHATRSLQIRLSIAAAAAVILIAAVLWPLRHRFASDRVPEPGKTPYVSFATFSLEPGNTRSGEGAQITLPAGIDEVHFELAVPSAAAAQTYQAVLGTAERPDAWKGVVTPQDGHLVAVVPVKVLRAGDYTLELERSGEEVMTFYFRVAKWQ